MSPEDTPQDQVSRRYHAGRVRMIAREGRGRLIHIQGIEEVPLAIGGRLRRSLGASRASDAEAVGEEAQP